MSRLNENLVQLLKGSSIIFVGTVIGELLGLLGQILIVRSLAPEEFGTIALAFTVVSIVSIFVSLGTPEGTARLLAVSDELGKRVSFLQSALLIAVLGGGIGATIVYFSRYKIQLLTESPGLAHFLSIFSLFVVISPLSSVLIGALRGLRRPLARVISKDFIGRSGAVMIFLIFLVSGNADTGAVAYWISMPILIIGASTYFLIDSLPPRDILRNSTKLKTTQELLSYSWPLAFSASFVLLMSQMDILIIGFFLDAADVGFYRAVQPLKQGVLFFLTSVTFLYLPMATEHYHKSEYIELEKLYETTTKWVVAATLPIVLMCVLFSDDLIRVLFTADYLPASTAFIILILGMFSRVLAGPNGATIQAIDQTQVEMYAAIVGGTCNFLLNIILVPKFGIEGAAVATGIGFLTYNSIEIVVMYREVGVTPFSKNIYKPILPTCFIGVLISSTILNESQGLGGLILIGISLGVVHLLSIIGTKSLDSGDKEVFQRLKEEI